MITFLRKHCHILSAAAIFIGCLLVFAIFWQLDVRSARQKSRSVYLNDQQETTTQPVDTGIKQTFLSDEPFQALLLLPAYEGGVLPGELFVTVYDDAGQLLASSTGNAAETLSGVYAVFGFPHAVESPTGVYQLEFQADMRGDANFSLVKSKETLPGWSLIENGQSTDGSLCIMASVDAIGTFVDKFYLGFALFSSAAVCLLFWLMLKKTLPLHRLFGLSAALLGLLYCLILPPYSAPAERAYINQSFNLSSHLLGQGSAIQEGTVVRRAGDRDVRLEEHGPTIFTYRDISRNLLAKTQNSTPTVFKEESSHVSPQLMLPSALGVTLARLLGLGFVSTLLLGRLVNLAVYVLLAALAVKKLPYAKGLWAAVALLPISLHLAASYNGVGLALAAGLLFAAHCLKLAASPPVSASGLCRLSALGLGVAVVSPLCLPFLLLIFTLPPNKQLANPPKNMTTRIRPYAATALAFLAPFFLGIGVARLFGIQTVFVDTALPPLSGESFAKTLLGGYLGQQSISLNWGFSLLTFLLLFFALLPGPLEKQPSRKTRIIVGIALVTGCALALFNSGAAPLAFLPLLPLALLVLFRNWGGLTLTRDSARPIVFLSSAIAVFSLLDAFLIILTR